MSAPVPQPSSRVGEPLDDLAVPADRVVRRSEASGEAAVHGQRVHPLRMLRREQHDVGAPAETPRTTARSDPTASSTAIASSTHRSASMCSGRSDRPMPRLSNQISRPIAVSRRTRRSVGAFHQMSRWLTNPGIGEDVDRSFAGDLVGDADAVGASRVPHRGATHPGRAAVERRQSAPPRTGSWFRTAASMRRSSPPGSSPSSSSSSSRTRW